MHAHQHDHSHTQGKISSRNLLLTTLMNLIIVIGELIGGIITGSLALISDSLHNFSDLIALLITYIAYKVSHKENNERKTYGYRRVQILTGLFNTSVLIGITIYLFIEAYHRIIHPVQIKAGWVIGIASIGLAANAISVILLKKDSASNLNIRSAYLHLLADTFSSVIVILGAIAIYFFGWYILDPVLTIIVGLFILKECYSMMKETINILMQSVPENLNLNELIQTLLTVNGVCGVHHVHVWQLDDTNIHFEGHIVAGDITLSQTKPILDEIKEKLFHVYRINHLTIQFEPVSCDNVEYVAKECSTRQG